ncbi:MAG: hypothetical protein QF752_17590, partial [Planctomycetota bacterium]|nr:hypothetical protein [Planctomycetota bacterium]
FPPEEAFLSYVVSSPATGHTTGRLRLDMLQDELIVHVAIARKHVVESYREVLRLTGLNPLGIGFSPFASLRVAGLFRSEERVGDASVVSFEGDHVTILVIRPGGQLISRSIPYGNQDLEEGTVGWIELFRREYERTVHWFHSVVSDLSIDEIHVSAPTDRLDVMREALNVIPSGKVMILSPASSCVLPAGVDPRQVSSHAAAAGAGMAALRPRGTSDFSDGDRPKPLISLTPKQIRATWVGLLVLLFLIVPKVYQEQVEGERQSLADELDDVKRDRKRLKPVVERVQELYSLDADRLPLLWVMGDHSEIFDTRKIYLQSFSMNKGERLDLHGFAKNAEVVSDLVRQISELDPYQAVFKSGSELGGRSRRKNYPYKFHIQVILPQTGREAFESVGATPSREEAP